MASYTTVLTVQNDTDNRRVMHIDGHTPSKPRLVIQKRKEAGAEGSAQDTLDIIYGTEDAAGNLLTSKVGFSVNVRRPNNGIAADLSAALAVFRDMVASDEFTAMVNSQAYVKQ